MPRIHKIKRMPEKIRDEVNKLIDNGRTIDEIHNFLKELGEDISRSSVGTYKKSVEEMALDLKESRNIANTLIVGLKDAPESKFTRANIEFLQSAILKLQLKGGELESKEMELLSRTLKNLVQAQSADAELTLQLKEEARKEALKAMETATKEIENQGATCSPQEYFKRIQAVYRGEI